MEKLEKMRKEFTNYLQVERNASPHTITHYVKDLNEFYAFLIEEGISELGFVDHQTVRTFLTFLYEKNGLARRSVSRKISSLRSFYKFLEREEVVKINPFINVNLPKADHPIPEFFYEQEIEKLFAISNLKIPTGQRNQALLELMYGTGIRVSECIGITIKDLDFYLDTVLVTGKGRKERYLPFGSFASSALQRYVSEGREKLLAKSTGQTDRLFLNARGNPLSDRGVRHVLNKMVKETTLTMDIHPHKLRHTFATHMLNEGADLRVVQELLGHENLSSTQIYTHVTKDKLRGVYMNSHPRANKRSN